MTLRALLAGLIAAGVTASLTVIGAFQALERGLLSLVFGMEGAAIYEVPRWASAVGAIVVAFVAAGLASQARAWRAFGGVALLGVALTAATVGAFGLWQVWVSWTGVTLALVLGYGLAITDSFVRERRDRRRLAQFFSPSVLREIVRHRDEVNLGSSRRRLTVLFSDIRGFTSISENMDPVYVGDMLREYLSEMTEVVFRHGGTVDKYIGDCIMALYNAPLEDPDHAANAVRTALEFQERTLAVSARWHARLGVEIRNGVGINTGDAVVGTMGSRQRLEYTAIGDAVNLASRLEGLTKEYGAPIIISESTYIAVRERFLTRELAAVAVRGKSRPAKIYAVLPGDIRKYPRALLDAGATLLAVGRGQVCAVRTRDIGEGGLSIVGLPPNWPTGAPIEIRCEGGGLPKPIVVQGTVVWRRGDAAGVAFTTVEPDAGPTILRYLSTGKGP